MTVDKKIYELRNKLGFTQKEFAKKVGVSQSAINYWENGKRQPRIEQLQKIADALNVPLFEFLDDELFDAATAPGTMDNAMYEDELIAQKIKSIEKNSDLSTEEKWKLIQDFYIQTEIMADLHLNNAEAAGKALLNDLFIQLNFNGQNKAIEQVELLTKIPEYQKKSTIED